MNKEYLEKILLDFNVAGFVQEYVYQDIHFIVINCASALLKHCPSGLNTLRTFFSGENLSGSTMYKSSGPTKEGREGAG